MIEFAGKVLVAIKVVVAIAVCIAVFSCIQNADTTDEAPIHTTSG